MISCINNTNNPEECMINAQCLSGYCKDFSKQSFDNTCAKYNLEGCSNATDCNKEGHIWNQADKNCTTKNFCQSANGIVVNSALYGKICTSKNLPQCAPNIITDCVYYEVSNDSTCTTNGGVWSKLLGDMYCVKMEKAEAAVCGNGKTETGEDCDDGNNKNEDGCSATCKIEKKDGAGNTENPCAPACKAWEKCEATKCVLLSGKCATDADCGAPDKICDIGKHECFTKKGCAGQADCDAISQFCDVDKLICLPLLAAGETCKSKEYCASDICTNGLCGCTDAKHCTINQFCDPAKNQCQNKVAIGAPCPTDPKNCLSGVCAKKGSITKTALPGFEWVN